MNKLYLIEKPIKNKPLLEWAMIWAKAIFSQLRFVGATFFIRHRKAVILPLATKVSPDSFSILLQADRFPR